MSSGEKVRRLRAEKIVSGIELLIISKIAKSQGIITKDKVDEAREDLIDLIEMEVKQ